MVQYDTAYDVPASDLPRSERAAFITRTYGHLLGAIMAFVILELVLFRLGWAQSMAAGLSRSWLLVLGGFVLVSWLATRFANTAESLTAQYAGLGLYVAAEAVLFAPLLVVADRYTRRAPSARRPRSRCWASPASRPWCSRPAGTSPSCARCCSGAAWPRCC